MTYEELDALIKRRALWLLRKKKIWDRGQPVSKDLIPTHFDLAAWYSNCPAPVKEQAYILINEAISDKKNPYRWSFYINGLDGLITVEAPPLGENDQILPFLTLIGVRKHEAGEESHHVVSLPEFYEKFEESRKSGRKLKDPLEPIIEGWQDRLRPITPYQKEKSIFPTLRIHIPKKDSQLLPELGNRSGPLSSVDSQLHLPSLEPEKPYAPFLMIYDMLGGKSLKQGPPAPVALRIFVEVLLSVPLANRDGNPYHMFFFVRDIVKDWLLSNPRNYRSNRGDSGGVIQKAFRELQVKEMSYGEHGAYAPVLKRGQTGWRLKDQIWLQTLIPKESKHGPMVNRLILRRAGKHSALAYRAYLSLCFFWNKYGTSHRSPTQHEMKKNPQVERVYRLIKPTRQEVKRNTKGQLINEKGDLILHENHPTTLPYAQGAVKTGARELNPKRDRYQEFDADQLLSLCFPLHELQPGTDREYLKRARKAIEFLETIEGCTIERLGERPGNGFLPWRIMPYDPTFRELRGCL